MNCEEPILPLSGHYKKQNFSCVYKIVSKSTGRHYIGSAKHFGIRRRNHVCQLRAKKHHSIILQNHVNKYGINDLLFFVLEVLNWDDGTAIQREQFYIDETRPYLNVLKNANSTGKKASLETRNKIRLALTGKKQPAEVVAKRVGSWKDSFSEISAEKLENRKIGGISRRKKVVCLETGIVYNSIASAEKMTGSDNVWAVCAGLRPKANGFTFKYVGE
jgi:group I intron endonuclease